MSQITAPVILDSTGQNIVTQLAAISAALAAGLPVPASTVPLMDGAGAVGSSLAFAREDHVHPSDTTRVPTSRTVNGKALSADIALTATDVGAATEQEIAYVENGTTATKTNGYAVGEYFCWHGFLYRAKTAIGNGDTFTENTNCEKVTAGGLNELKAAINEIPLINDYAPSPRWLLYGASDTSMEVGVFKDASRQNGFVLAITNSKLILYKYENGVYTIVWEK